MTDNLITRESEWVLDEWALAVYEHTLEGIVQFSPIQNAANGERSAAAELAFAALEMVRQERERRWELVSADKAQTSRPPEEISAEYAAGWRDAMAQENPPDSAHPGSQEGDR